jgi:hypothetical protein
MVGRSRRRPAGGTDRSHPVTRRARPRTPAARRSTLFTFDPLRRAVFLVGGDKTGQWNRWYAEMIPIAEELYDQYLRDEGLI